MKKTFLSLAFVLSISLAFGTETKPVVGESKVDNEPTVTQNTTKKVDKTDNKINTVKVVSTTDCFIVSCGTRCFTHETPLTTEQSLHIWETYDDGCKSERGEGPQH